MGDSFENRTKLLVLEECRHPYVLQLEENYQNIRLSIFTAYSIILIGSFGYYLKLRDYPRLVVRPLQVVFLLFIILFLENISNNLVEGFNSTPNFLNSCFLRQFSFNFGVILVLVANSLNLFEYYIRFKLYKAVTKFTVGSKTNSKNTKDTNISEYDSLTTIHSYTKDKFINIITSIGIFIAVLFGLSTSYIYCPELNDNFQCSADPEVFIDTYIFGFIGLLILVLLITVSYSTYRFPDPFGIIREVLFITVSYIFQVIGFFVMQIFYPPAVGEVYPISPYIIVSFVAFAQYIMIFPYQLYMANNQRIREMTFVQVLKTKGALKMFKLQIESELSAHHLQFYLAVVDFEKRAKAKEDVDNLAFLIYDKYVKDLAIDEINVRPNLKHEVAEIFENKGEITPELFTKLRHATYQLMHNNSYARFIRGPLYRIYLGLNSNDVGQLSSLNE